MDTLGSCDTDLSETITSAARQALHDWGRPLDDLADLEQDLWLFYLDTRNRSVRKFVESRTTEAGRRRVFYRMEIGRDGVPHRGGIASQILSKQQAEADIFRGNDLYSSDAVRAWLLGESTNKYLGKLISEALGKLQDQNESHREAVRLRYEEGSIPARGSATEAVLKRALRSLTAHVNAQAIEEKQGEPKNQGGRGTGPRRGVGGYSDPTADTAMMLMSVGDLVHDLDLGGTTTYREEFEMESQEILPHGGSPIGMPEGIFDANFADAERGDLYRAQVFPEFYPNEGPMLIGNWPLEDKQAYCGGEFTVGHRRLKVVR